MRSVGDTPLVAILWHLGFSRQLSRLLLLHMLLLNLLARSRNRRKAYRNNRRLKRFGFLAQLSGKLI